MLEGKWALVIEDDAHSLVAVSSILRDLGICFKRNTTGADVLEQVRAMNPLPNMILLNIDLAHADAFGIQQRLRGDSAAGDIPVIALASSNDFSTRKRVRRGGFAGLMIKPLPRRQFAELLDRVLAGEQVWEAIH